MTIIRTSYISNNNGTGKILAKGAGRQVTLPYDHASSGDRNHGLAAGTLALKLGLEWSDAIEHTMGNMSHAFAWEVK